jgi:large subunit ribosomal protein L1
MPNPRTGTVVQAQDIPRAISSAKKGRAEVRLDRTANIHARIGKVSFSEDQLMENLASVYRTVANGKPSGVKGQFVTTATVTTTMGPGIRMDLGSLEALANQD